MRTMLKTVMDRPQSAWIATRLRSRDARISSGHAPVPVFFAAPGARFPLSRSLRRGNGAPEGAGGLVKTHSGRLCDRAACAPFEDARTLAIRCCARGARCVKRAQTRASLTVAVHIAGAPAGPITAHRSRRRALPKEGATMIWAHLRAGISLFRAAIMRADFAPLPKTSRVPMLAARMQAALQAGSRR